MYELMQGSGRLTFALYQHIYDDRTLKTLAYALDYGNTEQLQQDIQALVDFRDEAKKWKKELYGDDE
jgi:hypothetical protein